MRTKFFAALGAAALLAGCAYDMEHAYAGAAWDGDRPEVDELDGPGVEILDRWLAETREGRAIVTIGFRDAAEGEVSEDVAHRANIWFRRYADSDHDMRITDEEIRIALVAAGGRYLR
ncbi:hypothetical protein [Sphingosinicella sp.]|uniref:hypothetical protein n=1 Tax=Sphingosinicella sp. TaxID=1917971 RepID=UPI0040382161